MGLDDLTRALWSAHAAGEMDDNQTHALCEAIQTRRHPTKYVGSPAVGKSDSAGIPGISRFAPRKVQRPPIRSVAIERRRRLAASGPMPPALAARFTVGELAALRIVADEVRARGVRGMCLDALAASAGVGRTTAQNAIRQARRLGMVEVQERRRPGTKSLPNLVKMMDRERLIWIQRYGFNKSNTTDKIDILKKRQASDPAKSAIGRTVDAKIFRAKSGSNCSRLRSPATCPQSYAPHHNI